MTDYIIYFLSNNLPVVFIVLFLLILFSFKSKSIKYFLFTMITLVSASLMVYYLHEKALINQSVYDYTCKFVCILMSSFELLVNVIFTIQGKIMVDIKAFNIMSLLVYILTFFTIFNIDIVSVISFYVNTTYSTILTFKNDVQSFYNNNIKITYKDYENSNVVMIC